MEHALDTSAAMPTWVFITVILMVLFMFLTLVGFIATRWKDGLWGAILLGFNLAFASLITLNYYEGLGQMLAGMASIGLFYWDSLVFILMFFILYGIFNLITNKISKVIVTFPPPVEIAGKSLVLIVIFAVFILGPVFYVVQIGPTAPKPFAGLIDLEEKKGDYMGREFRMAAKLASAGAMSPLDQSNQFDPDDQFLLHHYKRRCALFNELYKSGSSQFSGSPDFLN